MNIKYSIGYDDDIMRHVDVRESSRQKYIFMILSYMIIIISMLVFFASINLTSLFASDIFIVFGLSTLIALVFYNIYKYIIVTATNASNTSLSEYLKNHELVYMDYSLSNDNDNNLTNDIEIQNRVNKKKQELRLLSHNSQPLIINYISVIISICIRFLYLGVLAYIFAFGLEIYIFKDQINGVLHETKALLSTENPTSFLIQSINVDSGHSFIENINSKSLLLVIEILTNGLGNLKYFIDGIIILIFIGPALLHLISSEILMGAYVKELAIHEISISHYHYLKTQKLCKLILERYIHERK